MADIAPLSGSAARMLVRYLTLGGENESPFETMAATGTSRSSYFSARRQLIEMGWLREDGELGVSLLHQIVMRNGNVMRGDRRPEPISFHPAPSEPEPSSFDPSVTSPLAYHTSDYPAPHELPLGPRARLAQVDNMPSDGDHNQVNSAFQARRREQYKVLTEFWRELFDEPVSVGSLKQLLIMTGDYAEDVYDAMETAAQKKPGFPFAYVKGILKKSATRDRVTGVATGGATSEPESTEFRDPKYEANLKRLREMGLLDSQEGWDD